MSSKRKEDLDDKHLSQLLGLFPNGDPEYFRSCLGHYSQDPVERIADKVITELGGHYPQLPKFKRGDNRLNACLRILALDLFPDCDISFLRDRVLQYSYAHVEQVADYILSIRIYPERLEYGKMDIAESIRSDTYKTQAQLQLIHDFPQIWKSSIRAVLAENNWDYLKCYDQLKSFGSHGFWNTLKNFFLHWSSTPSHRDKLKVSDYSLLDQLDQLRQRGIKIQVENDKKLAHGINFDEYTECHQLITCDCCYGDQSFEQLIFCSEGQHAFCFDCITHFVTEGLFGQGSLRGQPRIHCISSTDSCLGCLPTRSLREVMTKDLWNTYEHSLLENSYKEEQQVQCCACPYFELDESIRPLESINGNGMLRTVARWIMWDIERDIQIAYSRVVIARRGNTFQCKNQDCKTLTCLTCHRPIRGAHICWEKESDGLRLFVEKAMADAVKRTCPNCSLSFQKLDGCNKITCPCGYKMCYICRKDIGKESYAHFCDHFRSIPGSKCTQCNRCDLYKTDSDDEAVSKAAERAKAQYLLAHPEVVHPDVSIGPAGSLERFVQMKQNAVLWLLERGVERLV
ncbi:hypothetical protein A0J61_04488 [Choanephora cucurbitarum]|uniref:RING-type domain-containing protein n=1 Tax=Choanephora cucurbitarum TaxID=101091 RepID=A0A1C7NEC8_9FUNG|nr:hypothetical protein A0J61_04488 [Choanephora cucurbitarum]